MVGKSKKKAKKGSKAKQVKQAARGAKSRALTEKQRRFVEAYMGAAAGNATEAARLAGYRGNRVTLESVGRENLGKPRIRAAVKGRIATDPAVATREERQSFWSTTMRTKRTQMKDRLKASELLGRSQTDFVERHEHLLSFTSIVNAQGCK